MSESNISEKSVSSDPSTDPISGASATDVREEATAIALTSSVGTLLCATRMRLGRDLQLVAQLLHIRYSYLVAIEDGRYEDLPGQAYAVGFVRAYADHLGLDGAEVVRRFKEENAGISQKIPFEFPIPTPDSGVPSGALLLLAVVFGMIVYGSWYSIAGSDRSAIQLIQEVPNRLMALLENGMQGPAAPVERPVDPEQIEATALADTSGSSELSSARPEDSDPPESAELIEDTVISDEESMVDTTSGSSSVAPIQPESSLDANEERNVSDANLEELPPSENTDDDASVGEEDLNPSPGNERDDGSAGSISDETLDSGQTDGSSGSVVELRAISDSWIQLREGNNLVLTRLLREGETFRVPEQAGLTLMSGNAGGLEVLVDGEVMAPLGEEGAIVRGLPIDPLRSSRSTD